MKLLLDTHAVIWALSQSRRLPPRLAALLKDTDNEVFVSVARAYEIEFKRPRSGNPALAGRYRGCGVGHAVTAGACLASMAIPSTD